MLHPMTLMVRRNMARPLPGTLLTDNDTKSTDNFPNEFQDLLISRIYARW